MSKRMNIGGYLIVELEDQLAPDAALIELIDNALDAGATIVAITLTRRVMSICDNGEGTDDPNLIATPSQSASRHKSSAIGSKAIGAKQACAAFGRIWDIQTVARGKNRYHHYKLAWDENGPLPFQYEGKGEPAHAASQDIRNGGTKITVTGRRDGFPILRLDTICRVLEEVYRPRLNSGALKITIRNPETGFVRQLQNAAYDQSLFIGPIIETAGCAAGRSLAVRYGPLKEHHRVLSYCHLIFGPRVIKTINVIGSLSLPSGCYIDVILSEDWKKLLSTNKTNIARYSDDLLAELERLLGEWIVAQKKQAAEYRLQALCGVVSDLLNETISYLESSRDGKYQAEPKPKVKKQKDKQDKEDEEEQEIIVRKKHKRRRRAIPGTLAAASHEQQRNCARLKLGFDEKLNQNLFKASFSRTGDEVEIRLNNGPHQREIAEYANQGRIDDLYMIAAMAFATVVAENRSMYPTLFSGLRKHGYEIDDTDPGSTIITMVSNFMIDGIFGRRGSIKKKVAAA